MKKYKVYIQAYYEALVEADSKDDARAEVINNLWYYFSDSEMICSTVVGEAEEIENDK